MDQLLPPEFLHPQHVARQGGGRQDNEGGDGRQAQAVEESMAEMPVFPSLRKVLPVELQRKGQRVGHDVRMGLERVDQHQVEGEERHDHHDDNQGPLEDLAPF